MPPPRRKFQATLQETLQPPPQVGPSQTIACVNRAVGNNLYDIQVPSQYKAKNPFLTSESGLASSILVELPSRFRSQIWLRRGSFILVEMKTGEETRDNKIRGEIINVVGNEKLWRKELKGKGWPEEFGEKGRANGAIEGPGENLGVVVQPGDMPPSEDDEE